MVLPEACNDNKGTIVCPNSWISHIPDTSSVQSNIYLLDELEAKYGPQSQILATRADYLEDFSERRTLYSQALDLAKKSHDTQEIAEIMDSIKHLNEEEKTEAEAGPGGPKTGPASAWKLLFLTWLPSL